MRTVDNKAISVGDRVRLKMNCNAALKYIKTYGAYPLLIGRVSKLVAGRSRQYEVSWYNGPTTVMYEHEFTIM